MIAVPACACRKYRHDPLHGFGGGKVIGQVFAWLGRKGLVFVALVVAMTMFAVWKSGDVGNVVLRKPQLHLDQAARLDGIVSALSRDKAIAEAELAAIGQRAQNASVAMLERDLAITRQNREDIKAAIAAQRSPYLSAVMLDAEAILNDRKRQLELAFLNRKIAGLERALGAAKDHDRLLNAARDSVTASRNELNRQLTDAGSSVVSRRAKLDRTIEACRAATVAVTDFDNQRWLPRQWNERVRDKRDPLVARRRTECETVGNARNDLNRARERRDLLRRTRVQTEASVARAQAWVENDLPLTINDIGERAEMERQNASRSIGAKVQRFWNRYELGQIPKLAAIALALIIALPFLIRLFCYFVLAPLAMRRPAIRLGVPGGARVAIPPADRSTTSVGVRLGPGEELLVRQDYLQTTGRTGAKGTQWFLDWRHMLTSFATGLTFLTRIRGEGEVTTVSAVRDPFAEVTIVTLPDGASCVLHPRALAAVVQPIRRRLRVETRWRLGSLNAWLTLQLRYVVFHGPARLVLKGGRGVRVERAERGRVFGQDQLVGFSADLSYSVTRTETFWPYLLGRETLLKDRVEAGNGVLIVEESPLTGRRGEVRRGIEGMIDAGMKVFGM